MLKMSEICILMSIFIAFVTTGYLWFSGQQQKLYLRQLGFHQS